jgi:hypothetical protein
VHSRCGFCAGQILSMITTYVQHALPVGIDILGLNAADQARIKQIGLWAWMDEVSEPTGKKPSRYSLEYRQAHMKRRGTRQKA